jgi:hypothetical protein
MIIQSGNNNLVMDLVKISQKLPRLSVVLCFNPLNKATAPAIPVAALTNCKKVITNNWVK